MVPQALIFGWAYMPMRNDEPLGMGLNFATDTNFDFAVDSVFTNVIENGSGLMGNAFLLLDGSFFLLLDGTDLLLL